MMHSANEHASRFFLLCAQAYVNAHFFLIFFFVRFAYTARPKTKETRDLSLILTYIYTQQKSSQDFFFDEGDKLDR
jgi:hypothetical protein